MGVPPSVLGGDQLTEAERYPAVAVTSRGGPGGEKRTSTGLGRLVVVPSPSCP